MHPSIGMLLSGKCYVYLAGAGAEQEPFFGTQHECERAIKMRDGSKSADGINPPSVRFRQASGASDTLREYVLTFIYRQALFLESGIPCPGDSRVFAKDRNEALKLGREIIRETDGRFGPKVSISARMANRGE